MLTVCILQDMGPTMSIKEIRAGGLLQLTQLWVLRQASKVEIPGEGRARLSLIGNT